MIGFVAENLGTIAISLVLTGVLSAIVAKMIRDKKKGRCIGCGGGCGTGGLCGAARPAPAASNREPDKK